METIKSIKEKAKAYDRAVEQMRSLRDKLLNDGIIKEDGVVNSDFQRIFPELKESEDERIRKSIIGFLKTVSSLRDEKTVSNKDFDSKELLIWAAWLEKQGEQKPKFRVGDTIKCKYDDRQFTIKSVDLDKGTYTYTQEGCGNDIDYADEEFELVEQNPAWSEEDEKGLGDALWCCKQAASIAKDENDMGNAWYAERWLKSIKERIQPQQEWSEEDDFMATAVEKSFYLHCGQMTDRLSEQYKKFFEKVKSIRPKSQWKPSDEQMKGLYWVLEFCNTSYHTNVLKELVEQLNELMEE